jgi:hypothetical protein
MRKLDALNRIYHRPPTNEHIERDFRKALYEAWLAVGALHEFLEALHKDGLLTDGPECSAERALDDLVKVIDRLDPDLDCDFVLDLPAVPKLPKELTDLLQAKETRQ